MKGETARPRPLVCELQYIDIELWGQHFLLPNGPFSLCTCGSQHQISPKKAQFAQRMPAGFRFPITYALTRLLTYCLANWLAFHLPLVPFYILTCTLTPLAAHVRTRALTFKVTHVPT